MAWWGCREGFPMFCMFNSGLQSCTPKDRTGMGFSTDYRKSLHMPWVSCHHGIKTMSRLFNSFFWGVCHTLFHWGGVFVTLVGGFVHCQLFWGAYFHSTGGFPPFCGGLLSHVRGFLGGLLSHFRGAYSSYSHASTASASDPQIAIGSEFSSDKSLPV